VTGVPATRATIYLEGEAEPITLHETRLDFMLSGVELTFADGARSFYPWSRVTRIDFDECCCLDCARAFRSSSEAEPEPERPGVDELVEVLRVTEREEARR
jgi:hypothetical protein